MLHANPSGVDLNPATKEASMHTPQAFHPVPGLGHIARGRRTAFMAAIIVFLLILLGVISAGARQNAASTLVDEQCIKCHGDYQDKEDFLAGTVISHTGRSKALMVRVGYEQHVITYTEDTKQYLDGRLEADVPVSVVLDPDAQSLVAAEIRSMPPIYIPDEEYITAEELYALVAHGPKQAGYALFDVRPSSRYAEGHIPTAVSLPLDQMLDMRDQMPADTDTLLIFYCGGEHCTLSLMAAQIAADWGYDNIRVYQDGTPVWLGKGYVLLSTPDFVQERLNQIALIDLRGTDQAARGHIPGAVAVTPGELHWLRDQFPADRRAYVVLYADDGNWEQMSPLVREIHNWGYARVSVLEGGYQAWQAGQRPENTTPVATRITYVHQPQPGEISKEAFTRLIQEESPDSVILDVRTPSEMSTGSLPQAVKIPLDELAVRINELPPDKEIVLHCASGMRAEIGHAILSRAGLNSHFLNDSVEIIGSKVYLGTTVALDESEQLPAGLDPSLVKIQVATTDPALSARLIRFGEVEFKRGRYAAAKAYFWRAILADPTSKTAWQQYDMSVIFTMADTIQRYPGLIADPEAPVTDQEDSDLPAGNLEPATDRSDEGC